MKICDDLNFYRVHYFKIYSLQKEPWFLAVKAEGLKIYDSNDEMDLISSLLWSDIEDLSYKSRKFKVKLMDRNEIPLKFLVDREATNQQILALMLVSVNLKDHFYQLSLFLSFSNSFLIEIYRETMSFSCADVSQTPLKFSKCELKL